MKFKEKYKWQDRDSHFWMLKRQREMKERIHNLYKETTPFLSFIANLDFSSGFHWTEEEYSVISTSALTSPE